jgi:hypothetical protein
MHTGVLCGNLLKKPLMKSRCRLEGNIKTELQVLDVVMD